MKSCYLVASYPTICKSIGGCEPIAFHINVFNARCSSQISERRKALQISSYQVRLQLNLHGCQWHTVTLFLHEAKEEQRKRSQLPLTNWVFWHSQVQCHISRRTVCNPSRKCVAIMRIYEIIKLWLWEYYENYYDYENIRILWLWDYDYENIRIVWLWEYYDYENIKRTQFNATRTSKELLQWGQLLCVFVNEHLPVKQRYKTKVQGFCITYSWTAMLVTRSFFFFENCSLSLLTLLETFEDYE